MVTMFDIKTWVEGLFRPVFRVDSTGRTYINRTPTVWDLGHTALFRKETIACPAVIGPYSTAWFINPRDIIVTHARIWATSQATIQDVYGRVEIGSDTAFVATDSNPAVSQENTVDCMSFQNPIYIKAGEGFRVTAMCTTAALRTVFAVIRYYEV